MLLLTVLVFCIYLVLHILLATSLILRSGQTKFRLLVRDRNRGLDAKSSVKLGLCTTGITVI